MKYENAKDILPASLLEEVQKYAEGKVIYIPKNEKSKGWGEASGYRKKLNKRNAVICSRYAAGAGIMELAEEFYLSPESIKKIVYGKKIKLPEYSPSIYSAEQYSNAGVGEEWARIYLENAGLEMPGESKFFLSELVKIPLRLIEDDGREGAGEKSDCGADVPLIIIFENHRFRSFCGGSYLALLRKEKKNAHQAFVFIRNEEYSYYLNNFGKQFQRGK
ncbi:CD3324 family protein [Butyrivibrio sp. LC3010]|uniref:CD3324 family protein n=1 Tax=Butyrivibrio sp. LC3010 TaxID=1280680 RepID=UPI000412E816|nr:CD3324 family protein [Butyrivibrio sp. LC3010]